MKTTPREGDYVNLRNQKSGELIHFIDANEHRIVRPIGFRTAFGEYTSAATVTVLANESLWFMVFCPDGKFRFDRTPSSGRELSLSDLLGDEEVVWSGDWWPPVGTECEFSYSKVNWFATKILFMGRKMTVFTTDHTDETERSAFFREIIFRPLKSERELAIEEMINLAYWPRTKNDEDYMVRLCELIYEAGYRKIKDAEK